MQVWMMSTTVRLHTQRWAALVPYSLGTQQFGLSQCNSMVHDRCVAGVTWHMTVDMA